MSATDTDLQDNHLIEGLPRAERKRLLALCVPVPLRLSEVLCERGDAVRHVYFPTSGFVSLIARVDAHPGVEVGMVGREGMLGSQLVLGLAQTSLRAVVQGSGVALRIERSAFVRELAVSAALARQLKRYVHVCMGQTSDSAACLRFHLIVPRLARWLLMSQDRSRSSHFHLTHEFLAYMLGVRRVGITAAASGLQRAGLISYRRGELTVLDRVGLEAQACSCYADNQLAYARLLGSPMFDGAQTSGRHGPKLVARIGSR